MSKNRIQAIVPLDFQWPTVDPFLFCVHHDDAYPEGNDQMGPRGSLAGRNLGSDFTPREGWRMYHGREIPGFPRHPHRGFETVTIVRKGLIDHSDSLGATARFGPGTLRGPIDVQWMTAGKGVEHCEMFPLVHPDRENPLELFQIWLNLPRKSKMVTPYFTMLWDHTIPRVAAPGADVRVVAGRHGEAEAPPAPPDSRASDAGADVTIWTIRLEAHARWTVPAAAGDVQRVLYFFEGTEIEIDGTKVPVKHGIQLTPGDEVPLQNGAAPAQLLLLGGRPIGEPVVQHGPFVMNSRAEIQQAFADYQTGSFGQWPWPSGGPVHARDQGRFAIHADGRRDEPTVG